MGTFYLQLQARGREALGWMESYGVELNPAGVMADSCFQMVAAARPDITVIGHQVVPEALEAVIATDSLANLQSFVETYREKSCADARATLWKKRQIIWEAAGNAEVTALLDHIGLSHPAALTS